jgi:phosphoglycolate phosphatase
MKIVLFDFDGVIADTFSFCYRIIHSRDGLTEDEYRTRFEGNINDAPKKAPQAHLSGKPFDFIGQYTSELMAGPAPSAEMQRVLKALAHDYILIIVSSTVGPPIDAYLTKHGLRDYFQEILGNEVDKSKVKKIQDVLRRYGLHSLDAVFITDTLGDIKEAQACGVRSIAVTWGYHPVETLEKGKPYKIVKNPAELLEAIQVFK